MISGAVILFIVFEAFQAAFDGAAFLCAFDPGKLLENIQPALGGVLAEGID